MFKKTCPWCHARVWPSQLGRRESAVAPRWYEATRSVAVCPYCNAPVRLTRKGQLWALLLLPFVVLLVWDGIRGMGATGLDYRYLTAILIAMAGAALCAVSVRLERSPDPLKPPRGAPGVDP